MTFNKRRCTQFVSLHHDVVIDVNSKLVVTKFQACSQNQNPILVKIYHTEE